MIENKMSYDKLLDLYNYFKSEYMLLSISYNSLKREYSNLKRNYKMLRSRFDNLRKLVDNDVLNRKLYVADYKLIEDIDL